MKKTQVELESRVVTGAHGVAAEEDHLVISKIVMVGVWSMLAFVVGGFAAVRILRHYEAEYNPTGPAAMPSAIGQYEVGIVNQRPFELDNRAEVRIRDQREALNQGWGEQAGQKAHVGLEQAMQQVVTDAQAAGTQPQPAPMAPPNSTPPAQNKP